jgi:hypothetical protein
MKFRLILVYASLLFFFATGLAHAAVFVTANDSYGIPASRILTVEPFGVLDNDTLDGENAGEGGATATLVTSVSEGTLICPDDILLELCADGSFEYIPDPGFDGEDSFVYQATTTTETSALTTVTLSACSGGPTVFSCWHENSYRAKLSESPSYNLFLEGFEGAAWTGVRSPDTGTTITAPSITNNGITWTTNHPATNEITTGSGAARTGAWGGFDPNHGFAAPGTLPGDCDVDNPPVECRPYDGLSGSGTALHGVGGYFSGTTGANIAIILDGDEVNQIGVGSLPDVGNHFFGVIDTTVAGFTGFEFRELDGKVGQQLLVFGDDFIIATTAAIPANNSPVLNPIGNRLVNENIQLNILLNAIDPDDGDSLSFSVSGTPAGASFFDNGDGTANFIWRPGFGQAGSYPLDFTVTDNGLPIAGSDSETITVTVSSVNNPGSLQFSAPTFTVAEDGVSATITVDRVGGSDGAVGVSYATGDGTATTASGDYTASSGTLSFADGIVSQSFTVPVAEKPG